jgi:hypothetical protein
MTTKTNKNAPATEAKNPPVAHLNLGSVQASIWARETEKGTFYDATFQRGYKTQNGWKNSRSFDLNGLLVLQHLVGQAIDKVLELRAAPAETGDGNDDDGPYIDDDAA